MKQLRTHKQIGKIIMASSKKIQALGEEAQGSSFVSGQKDNWTEH